MFVQVITAQVTDPERLKAQVERWERELRPGAEGFLGSTSGVTDDGRMVVLVRFESEEAANRNGERPEQSAWWAETEKFLQDVEFKNSVEVVTMGGGGSNDAGFVQVMRGHVNDKEKMEAMRSRMAEFEDTLSAHRPDVIGDVTAVHADGTFTDAIYFTSEADARAGEAKETPKEVEDMFAEFMAAFEVDEYLDLKEPHFI